MNSNGLRNSLDDFLNTSWNAGDEAHLSHLRLPRAGEVLPLVLDPAQRSPGLIQLNLPVEVMYLVEQLDGAPITWSQAQDICQHPEALGAVLAARNDAYEFVYPQGRVLFQCPHCLAWEAEFTLGGYMLGFDLPPVTLFEDGLLLLPPLLSTLWPSGKRPPSIPPSRRLRFILPGASLGQESQARGGVLGSLDIDAGLYREAAAWKRWAPEGVEQPLERSYWRYASPGFRAMLRLAVALQVLDGVSGEIGPAIIASLPITDFLFLDVLYYLSHNVDLPLNPRIRMACAACTKEFLAVL